MCRRQCMYWDATETIGGSKVNIDRNLARELCKELGIKWDENSSVPTVRGVPVTQDSLENLFSVSMPLSFSTDFSSLRVLNFCNYGNVDLKCA